MKESIIYTADDGMVFNERQKCVDYESLCAGVAECMSVLHPRPNGSGCNYENGGGYIQHSPAVAKQCYLSLLDLIGTKIKDPCVDAARSRPASHCILGRFIDDSGIECFRGAWHRFVCMSDDYREWGQPYYASNPIHAKQICLNS